MPNQLRNIRKFTDLVRYLESELEWPVEAGSFDDLTFEYQPAELGLKDEDAVKIKKVHQLRPLVTGQPWGVFFVDFEKKKLPVVVLRRILSHLVVKKRQSANKAEQAVWNPEDLLFISAFGDETSDQREIAFAHFHQQDGDLPTLRVLGWDGGDTPLKLDFVASELKAKLHWPTNPKDQVVWRSQWSGAFRHKLGHTIKTADALAEVLAELARHIRDAAKRLMKAESESGPLTKLYKGFQTALIHDLKPDDFADTYAQTITYGLLTAAISRTEMSQGRHGTVLYAENVTDMVPVTNPFLKEMLQTFLKVGGRKGGIDFDELGIQDVVELLRGDETDLPAILRDFGNKTRGEDPVIHFYEHFLSAYNKQLKIQRGVFYTPQPVVSYIVRSVHELLQTEFDLADGLASTATWGELSAKNDELKIPEGVKESEMFVQILDPATGTATFLVEVIDVIHRTLKAKWDKGGLKTMPKLPPTSFPRQPAAFGEYWNQYVPLALLSRLHGYELMMAPYAIAHMKIGLKLHETGYHFGTEERARIYLTNALEPKVTQLPQIGFDALAHEAAAVNEIKWYKRFTVVIGNPPYSILSGNLSESVRSMIDRYRECEGTAIKERGALQFEKNLQNDYVKFVRFGEARLQSAGTGIFGYITSHAFLTNRTLRGMRDSLLETFSSLAILNLHGNSASGEAAALSADDENVFDITEGVSISLFIRNTNGKDQNVSYAELAGRRLAKYATLMRESVSSTAWCKIAPESPNFIFKLQGSVGTELKDAFSLGTIFTQYSAGIISARDDFATDENETDLIQRAEAFATSKLTGSSLLEAFQIKDKKGWDVDAAKKLAKADMPLRRWVKPILYRPFDSRFIAYNRGIVWGMAFPTLRHTLDGRNLVLIGMKQYQYDVPEYCYTFVSRGLTDHRICVSKVGVASLFPLYLMPQEESLGGLGGRVSSFHQSFIKNATLLLELKWISDGVGDLRDSGTLGPEALFYFIYAQLHSHTYRERYSEFLKSDYPHVFLTKNLELFRSLARLGGELTALHLLESPKLDQPITEYIGSRSPVMEKVSWSKNTVWLDKDQTIGFKGVREDVWNFHIGGYQVCEKWLKDRKGRTLSAADREHYQKIVVALSETIRLMKEIDDVIEKHGGWPLK
jgi:hypothetical protein